ncbi:MAG: response regulator [Elusimicrobiota bacterium]|jgi:DNA-binding response OmpR family regulator
MRSYILVVDDDPVLAGLICDFLESRGLRATSCGDAAQAIVQASTLSVGGLVLDIALGSYGSGVDVYRHIRHGAHHPKDLPILFLTGMAPETALPMLPNDDPHVKTLFKPIRPEKLFENLHALGSGRWLAACRTTLPPHGGPSRN